MANLTEKHCIPCEGGIPPMTDEEVDRYLAQVGNGWEHKIGLVHKLAKTFHFPDFIHTMAFVNAIAKLAEEEGHHPDMRIAYDRLTLELYTHAIHGLSENDFILAAKINQLPRP